MKEMEALAKWPCTALRTKFRNKIKIKMGDLWNIGLAMVSP